MQIKMNRAADSAYHTLRSIGGRVYVVGGAVRDTLMRRQPKDIDLLVTGISPALLDRLPGFKLTGDHFGVYRYRDYRDNTEVEVALPRTEISTGPLHTDFEVTVDHTMPVEYDLERRDFTINAMALDIDSGTLIDPFGGTLDIEAGIIAHIGDNTFTDDPLRILRAFVLIARYDFVLAKLTRKEIISNVYALRDIPAERVQAELDKIFSAPNTAEAIWDMRDTGVLDFVFPELATHWNYDQNNKHHQQLLGPHQLSTLKIVQSNQRADADLKLAALLHDIGKPASAWVDPEHGTNHFYKKIVSFKDKDNPQSGFFNSAHEIGDILGADHEEVGADMVEARLRLLKYPEARIKRMVDIVRGHMWNPFTTETGARKFLNRYGDIADDLLILRNGDQGGKFEYPGNTDANLLTQIGMVDIVREKGDATKTADLAINGHDLIESGMKPGPSMGRILDYLTNCVIENPELNEKGTLITIAHDMDWEPNDW